MKGRHRKVLEAVFSDPVSGTIPWADVEALLIAAGFRIVEGKGSAVRFVREGLVGYFHRPHPQKEAARYQIRDVRKLLLQSGIEP